MTDQPLAPPPPPGAPVSGYPATFAVDLPDRVARWRPLVHWLLVIPHLVVLWVLSFAAGIVVLIAWFSGVLLGRIPAALLRFLAMTLRYNASVSVYAGFLHGTYPPFALDASSADPGADRHVRFDVVEQATGRSRLTIFFRLFMLIPHAIVLYFVTLAAFVVWFIGFFAVILLGRWPAGMRDFVVGVLRWNMRVNAYAYLLTDEYPPFSLS